MGKFVAAMQDYAGRTHPNPGGLFVVYRNGEYLRTAVPGTVVRRLFGAAPWTGKVQLLPVRIEGVEIKRTLVDVRTADGRVLPSVSVLASVVIDPTDSYASFVAFAAGNRVDFEKELIALATAAIEDMMRSVVATRTHDDLTEKSFMTVIDQWRAEQLPVASVLKVSGILEATFTPSAVVTSAVTAAQVVQLAAVTAEQDVDLAAVALDRDRKLGRIALRREKKLGGIDLQLELAKKARQLRLDTVEAQNLGALEATRLGQQRAQALEQILADAEQEELRSLGEIALKKKLSVEWAELGVLLGVPTLWLMYPERYEKQAAEANTALLALITGDPKEFMRRFPAVAAQLRADSAARLPQSSLTGRGEPVIERDAIRDSVAAEEGALVRDQKLENAWRGVFGSRPEGIAGFSRGREATVIVVSLDAVDAGQIPQERFASLLQCSTVSVRVLRPGTVQEIVAEWFASSGADAALEVDSLLRDGVLEIRIRGPLLAAKNAMDELDDPNETATTALNALFVHVDRVDVDLDDGPVG
ncbi:hypothetical protein GTU73_01005 [Rathayibacter sp. VKM Ac-2804]|uniref:hypothetical protein n=1 Tax=Rathayibacter sp. VKM Ac-2804 TaxID=2609257 RepID=UPI00132F2AF2|nr:hypothetical protein [Rathayibacter sp. VKM Ac-2804]QHF22723.1 hypothetical protein GTU73_01005 [Rathayibacter sp. VKM Ac-2804]